MNPYSVRATKAIGMVDMNTPAMGMKLQMKTNSDSSPMPAGTQRYVVYSEGKTMPSFSDTRMLRYRTLAHTWNLHGPHAQRRQASVCQCNARLWVEETQKHQPARPHNRESQGPTFTDRAPRRTLRCRHSLH